VDAHPDTLGIPATNVERLRNLGRAELYLRHEALRAWRAGDAWRVGGESAGGGDEAGGGGGGRPKTVKGGGSRERRKARRAEERGEGSEGVGGTSQ
jgi:hypothetical protein